MLKQLKPKLNKPVTVAIERNTRFAMLIKIPRKDTTHMMAGSKEDAETVTAFFEDMKRRGLNDPLLVTSDGAPGIIKAIEVCFPRAARQRCLAHRMRNLAANVPKDVWPDFKARAQAAYQAPSRAIACELAAGVVADYGRKYDSAVACFTDDFEACIAYLRFPVTHRRVIRTTNLPERLFVEERRRLKIVPNSVTLTERYRSAARTSAPNISFEFFSDRSQLATFESLLWQNYSGCFSFPIHFRQCGHRFSGS
jgi:transposase-like protein